MTQKSIPVFAAGVSANAETPLAIDQACTQCLGTLSSKATEVDFAVVSYTSHHIPESRLIAERVKAALRAKQQVGRVVVKAGVAHRAGRQQPGNLDEIGRAHV